MLEFTLIRFTIIAILGYCLYHNFLKAFYEKVAYCFIICLIIFEVLSLFHSFDEEAKKDPFGKKYEIIKSDENQKVDKDLQE